ncbi:terpene synthase family protein [Saccharomonospora sp. NPDC046836]|uniref:terpene synthase family protein n=1 Tax=Saccharomonospora sp. NPDC046836 TaxID=3156921 RepID=UPI0033F59F93
MGALLTRLGRQHQNEVPSLDDYTVSRLAEGGQASSGTLLAFGGFALTDAEQYSPNVRALEELADLLTMWDNDIFGHTKEEKRAARYDLPREFNLIRLIRHEHACTVQQALARATAMRDRVMCRFLRLHEQEMRDAGPELARYLTTALTPRLPHTHRARERLLPPNLRQNNQDTTSAESENNRPARQ